MIVGSSLRPSKTKSISPIMKKTVASLRILVLTLVFGLFVSGCSSLDKPASASFASVLISGKTNDEIQAATAAVFIADGYKAYTTTGLNMVFEKEGTREEQIAYAGLASGDSVEVRVRTEIVDVGNGILRLQCKAFIVTNPGDSVLEEEKALWNIQSKPYQKLLNAVALRLG